MDPQQSGDSKRRGLSANPFGYADHSAFAAFGAELVYGQKLDGALVHISAAVMGLGCDCICPACGRTLVARKGKVKIPHFSHHGSGSGCGKGAETNAHIWAKEVLEREKRILLPRVRARIGRETRQAYKERMFAFATVELEKPLDDIVPDVVLTTKSGEKLLVEVKVTHACGPEKIDKLRKRRLSTLEIDMGAWRRSSDRREIEEALIELAPREWLYNRKLEETEKELQASIERRAAEEAAVEQRRNERAEAERLARIARARQEQERKVRRLADAVASARRGGSDAGFDALQRIRGDEDLSVLLMPRMRCCGFLVANDRWQALILDRLVRVDIGESFFLHQFSLDGIVRGLEACIHPHFLRELDTEVGNALHPLLRGDALPRRAIEDFLYYLCDQGILQAPGGEMFEIAEDRAKALEAAHQAWHVRTRRQHAIDLAMEKILHAIPAEERTSFSGQRWAARPISGFDLTLEALVNAEETLWRRFDGALMAIEAMVAGGDPATLTLGLPLAGEIKRAEGRLQRREEQDAADRELELRREAIDLLEGHAAGWLVRPDSAGASPIDVARSGSDGLKQAVRMLEGHRREINAIKEAAIQAADCRRQLKHEAEKALGAAFARHFLTNYDARLKASPWNICIDQNGLRLARLELARWIERNRRGRRR